ncbi:MAG: OsmC family peroxiredoxin [Anaerolineales bacterium]|nr:OsmC family peroxiredoxin [Anaerolineales bacterium]
MPVRNAEAVWTGTLREGQGVMKFGTFAGPYTRASRFEEAEGTNPEELIGAAHAGCFSMFLASLLTKAGTPPQTVTTTAKVHLGDGPTIHTIELDTTVAAPNLTDAALQEHALAAKLGCPVSKALAGVDVRLTARLA